MKREYSVVVGNIGTVYNGGSGVEAQRIFKVYVERSLSGKDRAAGESVTLMLQGEISREHLGTNGEVN